jgi:UDP-N-acetylmuramoyl-L-alanyl-D-glutamate--2,6-diaminopimelate ligase
MSAAPGVSLTWLFDGIAELPANDARVEDLTLDSRDVRPGSLFFALRGHKSHGLEFFKEAVARGASVVLWDPEGTNDTVGTIDATGADNAAATHARASSSPPVFAAPVQGLRHLLGRIADRFFGWPSSHMRIVGITGTNGKTTSAYLLAQCLTQLKSNAAYMGTIGWGPVDALESATHTTPDVITLHRQLAKLRASGVRALAMEVSSHALDQGRVDAVRFEVAAFTNLTRDHLDYHPSMQAYGEAKARLFAFAELRHIVINVGDEFGRDFVMRYQGRVPLTAVWVGAEPSGWLADRTLKVDEVTLDLHGMTISVDGSFGSARVTTKLVGAFNAENAVVVLACLLALDVTLADATAALAACTAPPGRMELIEPSSTDKPSAVIDYAHTPDALAKALGALRPHCAGDLWCVFGCGGDRDPGKRPLMGAVADELADRIIVTDDNPRSEDPPAITRGIVGGITAHEARVIHDRGAAIATALSEAAAGDMVLIAGKGHEDYQIYGTTRRRFSDRSEALRHLRAVA